MNNTPNLRQIAGTHLDAVRGFALLLGVDLHTALSFMPQAGPPGIWAP
jgi:hypothetical protein